LLFATPSPYGFAISPDGNTAYVADDGGATGDTVGGIQKWTKSENTSWARQYIFTTTARGLTVDFSGANPVIYATTTETPNNKIIKIVDTGSSATAVNVASAGTNYVFRGVDFSPAATPAISKSGTLSAFSTTYGTPSEPQTVTFVGSNLTANVTATAPTGFEVSSDGTIYGNTATFTQSGGSASGTLRVRLKANAAVSGSYNAQNIVLSSTGATSVNIVTAATENAVSAKALTITANAQTVAVGSALANVTGSLLFTPSGLANNETVGSVSLSFGGNGASAGTFAGAIVPSAATGGTFAAGNYNISYVAGDLTVTPSTTTTYNEWLQAQVAVPSDANAAFLEYVYGAKTLGALDPSLRPTVAIVPPTAGSGVDTATLVLTYYVRQNTVGLTVTPKTSSDLAAASGDWTTVTDDEAVGSSITRGDGVTVQMRKASVLMIGDRQFLRAEAVQQ